jgi:hypothetical protein
VNPNKLSVVNPSGAGEVVDFGTLVWVAGIATRPVVADLIQTLGQKSRRGLLVDRWLRVQGSTNVWAIGDCAVSGCAPTAQVATQQGRYLGRMFNSAGPAFQQYESIYVLVLGFLVSPCRFPSDWLVSVWPLFHQASAKCGRNTRKGGRNTWKCGRTHASGGEFPHTTCKVARCPLATDLAGSLENAVAIFSFPNRTV